MKYLLLLILMGCGHFHSFDHVHDSTEVKPGGPTDPEFDSFILDFEIRTELDVSHIPVQFDNLKDNKVGVCHTWSNGKSKILIDRGQWEDKLSELQKEALIWHEFGHCELNFGHNDSQRPDKCPTHIMNWQLLSHYCYDKHYDDYIDRFLEDM